MAGIQDVIVTPADGWVLSGATDAPADPALAPGRILRIFGQLKAQDTARPCDTGGTERPQPAATPPVPAGGTAAATAFIAGTYEIAYTDIYDAITPPRRETSMSPAGAVTIAATQSIVMPLQTAFPSGVVARRYYFTAAPQGPPRQALGYLGIAPTTNASFTISAAGDGTWAQQANMGFGSLYLPAILGGGARTLSQSITPSNTAASTSAEQLFTVTGLKATDIYLGVSRPVGSAQTAGIVIGEGRVTSTPTIGLTFGNLTASTKTAVSGTYIFSVFRPYVQTGITIKDTSVGANSRIFFALRQGSTTPSLDNVISVYRVNVTVGSQFICGVNNIGQKDSLNTDWILDYWIINK